MLREQRRLNNAKWNRIKGSHHRGMRLEAVVARKITGGYLVDTGRGRHLATGFLRDREIRAHATANANATDRAEFAVGDLITVFVQDYDDDNLRLLLSLEDVDRAVATQFLQRIELGAEVVGRVVDHGSAGVYVRLPNGFEALIPYSEVPQVENCQTEDVLHLGDEVIGVVLRKSITKRQLHLSPAQYLSGRKPTCTDEVDALSEEVSTVGRDAQQPIRELNKATNARRVVVLDDDTGNLTSISGFLEERGHQVFRAENLAQFYTILANERIECAVVDIHVHGKMVIHEVLDRLKTDRSQIKVITCSAVYEPVVADVVLATRSHVIDALVKPVSAFRLAERVDTLENAERFELEEFYAEDHSGHYRGEVELSANRPKGKLRDQILAEAFDGACKTWPHDAVLLVHRPRRSRDPELVHAQRIDRTAFERQRLQLKYSAIGRVINECQTIDHMDSETRVAEPIRLMFDCACLLGTPVFVLGQPEYGIFVLRSAFKPFADGDTSKLERIAWELHLALERAANMENMADSCQRLSTASLLAGVAHETGNAMNHMVLALKNLSARAERIERGTLSEGELKKLAEDIRFLDERGTVISTTLRAILGCMSKRSESTVRLHKLLAEMEEVLQPQAKLAGIGVKYVHVASTEVGNIEYPDLQIRQSVFNMMLNAVQHLQSCKTEREKIVRVEAGVDRNRDLPIWIAISDNGFGIHYSQREEVFEPYFTTRPDGSGFGLYLTRSLIESIGGRVTVHESIRFKGSTFRVELPDPRA